MCGFTVLMGYPPFIPLEEPTMTGQPCITAHVHEFRKTKNILVLITILILVIRQRRTLELLYGAYCNLFHRPSPVRPSDNEGALNSILNGMSGIVHDDKLSRGRLIELYGADFKVSLLPSDFQGARCESICQEDGGLIIGEYGENSRIAYLTRDSCVMSDYYRQVPGVRHIHSIERYGNSGELLVSTGDGSKLLDLWVASHGKMRFVKRLRRYLAGFTAAINVNGEYYFGTDFSSRPNFIGTLRGEKFFFPTKAYNLFVSHFYAFFDRYIVSINSEIRAGGRQTLSVFDTLNRTFIFCEDCAAEQSRPQGIRRTSHSLVLGTCIVFLWEHLMSDDLGSLVEHLTSSGFLT
jgi:hypothetical protein